MEIQTTVRVRNDQEIEEYFNFDEILNIRYYEKIGENFSRLLFGCLNVKSVSEKEPP